MPMDGPIWLLGATTSDTLPAYDWPLSESLSMFLIPDTGPGAGTLDLMSGVAHRIADPKAASQLRELRERFLADAERELEALRWIEKAAVLGNDDGTSTLPRPRMHRIDSGDALSPLGQFSKLNPEWALLQHVRDIGREKADAWLTRKASHVGERSTFRL